MPRRFLSRNIEDGNGPDRAKEGKSHAREAMAALLSSHHVEAAAAPAPERGGEAAPAPDDPADPGITAVSSAADAVWEAHALFRMLGEPDAEGKHSMQQLETKLVETGMESAHARTLVVSAVTAPSQRSSGQKGA
eukprot:COSAG01_NODE_9461_length_2441_cov_1.419300_1_plen_135_part_00